jgi:hypothetical protein
LRLTKLDAQVVLEFLAKHKRYPSAHKGTYETLLYQRMRALMKRDPEFRKQVLPYKKKAGRPKGEVGQVLEGWIDRCVDVMTRDDYSGGF